MPSPRTTQIPLTFTNTGPLSPYLPPSISDGTSPYPHVTLTYAQSLDGQISLQPGMQTLLSGPETKAMTHYLRSVHSGILIGANTAKADNPSLNSRFSEDGVNIVGLERQPRPFVLDPSGKWSVDDTPKMFALAKAGDGREPSWIMHNTDILPSAEMWKKVRDGGGMVIDLSGYKGREYGVDWDPVLRQMKEKGVESVMIEGGGVVIKDLLRKENQKFISSVIVTVAPTFLGAGGVDISPKREVETENQVLLRDVAWIPMGQDVVMAGFIK